MKQQQKQKKFQIPSDIMGLAGMGQPIKDSPSETRKLFHFTNSFMDPSEPSTKQLLNLLKINHLFIGYNEDIMNYIKNVVMKQLPQSPTRDQHIFTHFEQAEIAYTGKKVIIVADADNAESIVRKQSKCSRGGIKTWTILEIYVLIENQELRLYQKPISNKPTNESEGSKQSATNQNDEQVSTGSSISSEGNQEEVKLEMGLYSISDKIEFINSTNIMEASKSTTSINMENLLYKLCTDPNSAAQHEVQRLSMLHLVENLKQYQEVVNVFIVTTGPRADKAEANRYHEYMTYILSAGEQLLTKEANDQSPNEKQENQQANESLQRYEELLKQNMDAQIYNEQQMKWKKDPQAMGIGHCNIKTHKTEQQEQIKTQKNEQKQQIESEDQQSNYNIKEQSAQLAQFLSNFRGDQLTKQKVWNIVRQYTNENNFHKTVSHYIKMLSPIPFGTKPLQFPIMAIMKCLHYLFLEQLESIVKWMKGSGMTELKIYRGGKLNETDRNNFKNCVGHIVQFKGFMSTSHDFDIGLRFAGNNPYLIEVIVPLVDLETYLNQLRDEKDKIPEGQGFALIERISFKPEQKQIVLNTQNYFQILEPRSHIIDSVSQCQDSDPSSQDNECQQQEQEEQRSRKITIYSLRLINPKLSTASRQSDSLATFEKYPLIPQQFANFYEYQVFIKGETHAASDYLLLSHHYKEAQSRLLSELQSLLTKLCPNFKLSEYASEIIKGLKIQLANHSINIKKPSPQPYTFQSQELSANYFSQFSPGIPHSYARELLFICYKLMIMYRQTLQVQGIFIYAHLFLFLHQFYDRDFQQSNRHGLEYSGLLLKINGLIYLSDCYFVIGMYEARLQILKKMYKVIAMHKLTSKLEMHPSKPVLSVLSRILQTQKLLRVPYTKQYLDTYRKLCRSILKDGINGVNVSNLYNFIEPQLYNQIKINQIIETVGKQASSAAMFGIFKSFMNSHAQYKNKLPPAYSQHVRSQEIMSMEKEDADCRNQVQQVLSQRKKRTTALLELFGTRDEGLIQSTVSKIIKNNVIIKKKYRNSPDKEYERVGCILKQQSVQDDPIYMKLKQEFIIIPLMQARHDTEQQCQSYQYFILIQSIAFKAKVRIQRIMQPQHLEEQNKKEGTISLIKQQSSNFKNEKPYFCIEQQKQNYDIKCTSSLPLLSALSMPQSLFILECKKLPQFQRAFRSLYIKYYSEQFLKCCHYIDQYSQAVLFYEEWYRLVQSIIEQAHPIGQTIGGILYFEWMLICQSLPKVVLAFSVVKCVVMHTIEKAPAKIKQRMTMDVLPNVKLEVLQKLTLAGKVQDQILQIFDATLSHISRVRFGSELHIFLLFQLFKFKGNIRQMRYYGLDQAIVGSPLYRGTLAIKPLIPDLLREAVYNFLHGAKQKAEDQTSVKNDLFFGPLKELLDTYTVIAHKKDSDYNLTDLEQNVLKQCIKISRRFSQFDSEYPNNKEVPNFISEFLNIGIKDSIISINTSFKAKTLAAHKTKRTNEEVCEKFTNLAALGKFDELICLLGERLKCDNYDRQFYDQETIIVDILKKQLAFKSCENVILSGMRQTIQGSLAGDELSMSSNSSTRFSQSSLYSNHQVNDKMMTNLTSQLHSQVSGFLSKKTKIILYLSYYVGLSARPRRLFEMLKREQQSQDGLKVTNFISECVIYYQSQAPHIRHAMFNKLKSMLTKQNKDISNQLALIQKTCTTNIKSESAEQIFGHLPPCKQQKVDELVLKRYISAQLVRNRNIFDNLLKLQQSKNNKDKSNFQLMAGQFEWLFTITPMNSQIQILCSICKLLSLIPNPLQIKVAVEYILIVVERLYRINELSIFNVNKSNSSGIPELLDGSMSEFNELQLEVVQCDDFGAGDNLAILNKLQNFVIIFEQVQNCVKIKHKSTSINYLAVPILLYHLANICAFSKLRLLALDGPDSNFNKKKFSNTTSTKALFKQLALMEQQSPEKLLVQTAKILYKSILGHCKPKSVLKLATAQYKVIMLLAPSFRKSYFKKYKFYNQFKQDKQLQQFNHSRILRSLEVHMKELMAKIKYCDESVWVKLKKMEVNYKMNYCDV